jgi:hypothetical protein
MYKGLNQPVMRMTTAVTSFPRLLAGQELFFSPQHPDMYCVPEDEAAEV